MPGLKPCPESGLPEKTRWHPYALQSLTTEKFIQVVNRILRGEYTLIRLNKMNESEKVFGLTNPQEKSPQHSSEKSLLPDTKVYNK